jgi:hypothetical protein
LGERNCFVYLVVPVVVDGNEEIPRQKCSHSQKVEHQPDGPENKYLVSLKTKTTRHLTIKSINFRMKSEDH